MTNHEPAPRDPRWAPLGHGLKRAFEWLVLILNTGGVILGLAYVLGDGDPAAAFARLRVALLVLALGTILCWTLLVADGRARRGGPAGPHGWRRALLEGLATGLLVLSLGDVAGAFSTRAAMEAGQAAAERAAADQAVREARAPENGTATAALSVPSGGARRQTRR